MNYELIIGWILDFLFGDPAWLPHPVVYMGKWISFWEHRLNKGNHRKVKGAVFAVVSIVLTFVLMGGLLWGLRYLALSAQPESTLYYALWAIYYAFGSIIIFFCLAGHTLRKEVRMVFEALDRSLDDGRKQVARIVGRDTQQLSAQEVRTAALETLAENLSDGVIAPLFWMLVAGVPGMLAYKMVNTLDSMIGYQNERYKDFGCWAAHIDDVANYIPARLTALLMILAPVSGEGIRGRAAFVLHFAKMHASPNSGWPESALAGILDCQFGGTHNYFGQAFYKPHIGTNPRPLTTQDMKTSIRVCFFAEVLFVVIFLSFASSTY